MNLIVMHGASGAPGNVMELERPINHALIEVVDEKSGAVVGVTRSCASFKKLMMDLRVLELKHNCQLVDSGDHVLKQARQILTQ